MAQAIEASTKAQGVRRTQLKRLRLAREYRSNKCCERCGESHPDVLTLHHKDPTTKHRMLRGYRTGSGNYRQGGRGWGFVALRDLEAEFAKCEVLCANCHLKEHRGAEGY